MTYAFASSLTGGVLVFKSFDTHGDSSAGTALRDYLSEIKSVVLSLWCFRCYFCICITLVIFQLLSAYYSDYRIAYNQTLSQGVMSFMSIVDLF